MSKKKSQVEPPVQDGVYRHYKGGSYLVLHVGKMEEDATPVVIYKSYSTWSDEVWVRPLSSWGQEVLWLDGTRKPRFVPR